ncbi:MAG: hypothetical protein QOJ34_2964 [Pseudonocardiales bacterium]|jgi:hypothetical protein|nr:hypothetical protein [Pseudonocardiales bacterium]
MGYLDRLINVVDRVDEAVSAACKAPKAQKKRR